MKTIFEPNVWIKGEVDGNLIVGRTIYYHQMEIVAIIGEDGTMGHIAFNEIVNIKKLHFIKEEELTLDKIEQIKYQTKSKPISSIQQHTKQIYCKSLINEFSIDKLSENNRLIGFKAIPVIKGELN